MAFTPKRMFPGDFFDFACKFAVEGDTQLAAVVAPSVRAETRGALWNEVTALGWSTLLVPEEHGGAAGSLLDLAAVLEGCGTYALPLPVLTAFGIAPLLLRSAKRAPGELLAGVAEGKYSVCPVLAPLSAYHAPRAKAPFTISETGNGFRLQGEVQGVEAVPNATHYLLAARSSSHPVLLWVPANASGISNRDSLRLDSRASVDLLFANVDVEGAALLDQGAEVESQVAAVSDLGALLVCVETVAAMGTLIEQTIAYLIGRKQFGQTLSSFQVLRHYTAYMYVSYDNLFALLKHTLQRSAKESQPPQEAIALLKLRLADASRLVAHTAIQLHGGMGVTEELLATRLAKRILMSDFEYGDGMYQADRLLAVRAAGVAVNA